MIVKDFLLWLRNRGLCSQHPKPKKIERFGLLNQPETGNTKKMVFEINFEPILENYFFIKINFFIFHSTKLPSVTRQRRWLKSTFLFLYWLDWVSTSA
jgi:hypothetical protein